MRFKKNKENISVQNKNISHTLHTSAKSIPAPDTGINFVFQKKENKTGLPDNLKSGIEHLSGMDISDVKVHYNSNKPTQLNAHAYAQGNQIHIAPGQQKHLAHEAWHVVQQKQGRVKPTKQLKEKININDDAGLEKEADIMGSKAFQMRTLIGEPIQQKKLSVNPNNLPFQLLKDSEIKATFKGNGISKANCITLKKNRPVYADGQVDAVWDAAAKDANGKATCPSTGKKITWVKGTSRQGVWDMGHKPGHEYKKLWESLAKGEITYAAFLTEYRKPGNYQVEDPSANRSGQFEA